MCVTNEVEDDHFLIDTGYGKHTGGVERAEGV